MAANAQETVSWSLVDVIRILQTHISPDSSATSMIRIPSGSHVAYEVRDAVDNKYILKLGAYSWPQKIETEAATLIYLRAETKIPVPTVRGYRTGDWQSDYLLTDFIEGEKLCFVWEGLTKDEQISYVKQLAGVYAELDCTAFSAIGSLRLNGTIGPLDTLDTTSSPNGSVIGVVLGPYENLRAYWRGVFDNAIDQLAADPLLSSNADLIQDLRGWTARRASRAPDAARFSLFGLECLKYEDIIVKDGEIVGIVDLENFQTNVPEFLMLYAPLRLRGELEQQFSGECARLGVRAWLGSDTSKACYDYCLRNTLFVEQIVPGDYNSYRRIGDIAGLKVRLAEVRVALLEAMQEAGEHARGSLIPAQDLVNPNIIQIA